LEHTTFWDQLILIDKFEPPSICYKPHSKTQTTS
jgi:hypothetical protein